MSTNRKPVKALRSDRVIFITGEITDVLVGEVIRKMLQLDKKCNKDILLILNTDGGEVTAGHLLINFFKLVRSDISILVPANAQSIGSIILASGTKGKRIVMNGTIVMMHGSVYELPLNAHKIQKSDVDFQERHEQFFVNVLRSTGYKTPETSLASEYTYHIGQEIIDVGLADNMINSLEELHNIVNL